MIQLRKDWCQWWLVVCLWICVVTPIFFKLADVTMSFARDSAPVSLKCGHKPLKQSACAYLDVVICRSCLSDKWQQCKELGVLCSSSQCISAVGSRSPVSRYYLLANKCIPNSFLLTFKWFLTLCCLCLLCLLASASGSQPSQGALSKQSQAGICIW